MSQNNAPAVIPAAMQNLIMTPPSELFGALMQNFQPAYEDFNSSFRSISFKGFQFTLRDAGSETVHPSPNLPVVILGMAPDNHCTWYRNAYDGTKENVQPDAVWYQKQPVPANVPASVLAKSADGRNQYQISRRIVVALLRENHTTGQMYIDLDNPYVMDCGSMSVFGDDIPDQWAFSLAGLIRFCSRAKVLPLHFVTNVIFDRRQSVPSIRFVPSNQNGQLLFLDADSLAQVYRVATSQTVTDMLHVRLIPDPNAAVQQADQPVAQPAPAAAPVQPVAPAAPVQPVQPAAPVQPVQPAAPVAPVQPVAPASQPVAPVQPVPAAPVQPAPAVAAPSTNDLMAQAAQAAAQANAMLNQAAPVAPAQSFSQPAPAAPVQPVQQPAGPAVAPVQPVAPAAPVQPAPAAPAAAPVQPAPTSDSAMMNNALADLLSAAGSYGPQA